VRLSWRPTEAARGTKVFYGLVRTAGGKTDCTAPSSGAGECLLNGSITTWTPNTTVTDRPGRGRFWYRIAAVADNRAYRFSPDVMLIGPAVTVRL